MHMYVCSVYVCMSVCSIVCGCVLMFVYMCMWVYVGARGQCDILK